MGWTCIYAAGGTTRFLAPGKPRRWPGETFIGLLLLDSTAPRLHGLEDLELYVANSKIGTARILQRIERKWPYGGTGPEDDFAQLVD